MNKYFKYSFLSLFAALSLVSCDNEYEYEAAVPESEINAENNQVYFPIDSIREEYTLDGSKNSLELIVCRIDTIAEKTIRIEAEGDSLVSVPETLTFAAGEAKATLNIAYNAETLGYENPQTVTLWIADSTQTTIYGMSKYQFKINLPAPWTSLGMATVMDDIMTAGWNVPYESFEVEIQENDLVPGLYRLVNPYTSSYPWNEPGDFDESKDYYLEIHAEDPDAVWFGRTELGLDWGYGMISAWSIADYFVQAGNAPEKVKESGYYGTLKDGEITFPVKGIVYNMPQHPSGGESWYYTNAEGMFSILLPGYVKADYSAEVQYAGIFTAANDTVYAVGNLTLGADATDVKAIVMPQDADASAVADAIAAGELEAVEVEAGRIEVPFDAEELATDKYQIIVVVLADNEAKTVATTSFEYFGGGANPWQSIGTGFFTDDIIAPIFEVAPPTYEVEILANEEQPGIYRVMNPYSNSVYPLAEDDAAPEGLYLEVNAADAAGVYIQAQSLGFDWGKGEFGFMSEGARYMSSYDFETIKKAGLFGTLTEGVIKFPVLTTSSGIPYQGYVLTDGELAFYAGMNGKIEITLPTANAFAKNMAKAKAKVSSMKINKGNLAPVKVEKEFKRLFIPKTEAFLK